MLRFVFLVFIGVVFSSGLTVAQTRDTTYLNEVRIYGLPVNAYATGSKTEQIKTGEDVTTLSDKLINETAVYLRTYGNNQLSTITLRGTTASQTAVLWNGMNINSPTLGQTDFSLIPLFLFDEVAIRYGSASSLYGSDAIGGSVLIGNQPALFQNGFRGTLLQQFGSFGKVNTGIKATYGNTRWELRTKLYRSSIENDFPYRSQAVGHSKKQNQASVRNYGFDQQVHLKISETQQLSVDGMYTNNFREIQPAVTNDKSNESLRDRHIRLSFNYQNESRFGILSATAGYIDSDQDYSDDLVTNVRSKQFTSLISMDKFISNRASVRYGASYSLYKAFSQNYVSAISENRFDGFVSFRYALHRHWLMNVNLRQSGYARRYAPFAPSVGTEVHMMHTDQNKLVLRAQGSRAFRVPTLNDRYWVPGGNPNVAPEDAWHLEAGAKWTRTAKKWQFILDGAVYRTWVNEMIVWVPAENVWSPTNLQKVKLYGLEIDARSVITKGRYQIRGVVLYSYTRSINEKSGNGNDEATINKQLAYVPIHSARASASLQLRTWELESRVNVIGTRYISLDNDRSQALDPYGLVDVSLSKQFRMKQLTFLIRGEALNLLDVYYENIKNHAMPGRNFAIGLTLNFNNQKTL